MRLRELEDRITHDEHDLSDALEDGFTTTHLRAVQMGNIVFWEGNITMKAGVANGNQVLTTPDELAPKQDVVIGIFASDGTDYGVLRFHDDATVTVEGSVTASKEYTLSGLAVIDPYKTR